MIVGVAWLPTSNLLFATGIVLAERTLYLPTVGLALLGAAGADALFAARRRIAPLILAAAALPLAWTTFQRITVWRSTRDLVISALLAHPESYKVHQSAARVLWRLGRHESGLAEYRIAAEIYPLDQYLLTEIGSAEIEAGHVGSALRTLRRSESLDSSLALTQQLLAQACLLTGAPAAALGHARRAVAAAPDKPEPARMLAASHLALGQRDSALAVWVDFRRRGGSAFERWLLGAVTYATAGFGDSAMVALDSARALVPSDTVSRRRLGEALAEVGALRGRRPVP